MSTWHSIDIKAGPYSWHVTKNMGAAIGDVLDGLKVSTAWADDHPIHGEPKPAPASFSVVVASIRDVADLTVGSPVTITVWYDEPQALMPWTLQVMRPALVHYMGRVGDLDAVPTSKGRMIVTVSCTDYLQDLAERTVGEEDWPQELLADRITRVFTEAGIPCPVDFLYGTLVARETSPVDALTAAQATMANQVDLLEAARYVIPAPVFTSNDPTDIDEPRYTLSDAPDPNMPYQFMTAFKRPINGNADNVFGLPAVLAPSDAGVTVILDPLEEANVAVLPASMAHRDTSWHKARSTRPDAVRVTSRTEAWYYRALPNAVPIEFRFDSDLVATGDLVTMGNYLLPDQVEDGWSLDEVHFFDLPADLAVTWLNSFFFNSGTRAVSVIDGVVGGQNPNGGSYYIGMVINASIEFRKGDWDLTLQLRPDVPRPHPFTADDIAGGLFPGYLSCANLAADPTLGATTPADLDPAVTPYDLRIVRRPD